MPLRRKLGCHFLHRAQRRATKHSEFEQLPTSMAETEDQFMNRITDTVYGAFTTISMGLGHHLGLFQALVDLDKPVTSQELADHKQYKERYVREWLGVVVTGKIVDITEDEPPKFYLPKHRRAGVSAMGPAAYCTTVLLGVSDDIEQCFRKDGPAGLPYSKYPNLATFCYYARQRLNKDVILHYCKVAPGIKEKLESGLDVLEAGCSTGVVTKLYATLFPNSKFTAFDIDGDALVTARQLSEGVPNITYQQADINRLPQEWQGRFDLVIAHDMVHDLPRPDLALKVIHGLLKPGGLFFMVDIYAESDLRGNVGVRQASTLYTCSLFHCMPVALFHEGGLGVGTCWGHQLACRMMREAGFSRVEYKPELNTAWNAFYAAYKD